MPAVVFTGGPFAYLKIAEGCDHRCTFCAIPGIRGAYRSRPIRNIVREAETLLAKGNRELNLISQDTTAYGTDLGDGVDLPALLRALGKLGGRFWVRALYGYPPSVDDRLLAAMAETPAVCHYLDLPIQHSHPDILRRMGRAKSVDLERVIRRIRRALPDVTLRTTCLVGFPGETEEHFRHLVEFVQRTGFDHLGVFAYSPEEGTPAERMPDRPPHRVANARRAALLRVQAGIVARRAAALKGRTAEVLLESGKGAGWIARAARQAPEVDGVTRVARLPPGHKPGDFVTVRYTGAAGYDLKAG
jgi:ribosomal protein S12 methylthiotransferase